MKDKYTLPEVSIIVVNYNGKKYLRECFDSILSINYPLEKLELIMVDNGSQDGSIEFVEKHYPNVRIIRNQVNNYCRANNLGIKASKGKYVVLLNNDTKVDKNWLIELVKVMESDEKIGAVGSKVLFMDGRIQSVGHQEYPNFYWGDRGFMEEDKGQYDFLQEVPSLCGACTMYRRRCLDDVGLLDEDFIMFVEDVDMAIRCRKKGWKLLMVPSSVVYHHYHGTALSEETARYYIERNRLLLIAKHHPEKLPQALAGREYFIRGGQRLECEFMEIFGNVLIKLMKEHGIEMASKIIPDLLTQLHQIFNLSKDHIVQELAKEKKEKETLHKEKDTLLNELGLLREEIKTKESHICDLQCRLAKYEGELREMQLNLEQMSRLNEEIAKVRKEREERIEELARLNEKYRNLIDELIRKEEKREKEIQGLIKERDEYLLKLSELNEIIKCKDEEISELSRIKEELTSLVAEKDSNIQSLYNELQSIYNSTGFRYLLKPLWTILWPIKQFIRKITFKNLFRGFSLLPRVVLRHVQLLKMRKGKDKWVRRYFAHLFKGHIAPPPEYLTLMITSKCNLRCRFCEFSKGKWTQTSLPKQVVFKVIDSVALLGVKKIDITGGEPLLYPDLWEVIDFINKRGLEAHIVTNGVLIMDNKREFKESKLASITVSLDGTKGTHESLRNCSNCYDKIVEGIRFLVNERKNVFINFVITKDNLYELEKILEEFSELKVPVQFWPVNGEPEFYITDKRDLIYYSRLIKKFRRDRVLDACTYEYLKKGIDYFKGKGIKVRCLGLGYNFAIDVNGNILPCCVWSKQDLKLGNIYEDDLEELWYSERAWEIRREIFERGCEGCWNTALIHFYRLTKIPFIVKGR